MNLKKRVFFISGHRDITQDEFDKYYVQKILNAIDNYDAYFLIGDYHGCDIMAQDFLIDYLSYDVSKITVCHMNDKPMNINPEIIKTVSGFNNDINRDTYMTEHSDEDIAFIRSGKENSGTAQNIIRRLSIKNLDKNIFNKFYDSLQKLEDVTVIEWQNQLTSIDIKENPYYLIIKVSKIETISIISEIFDYGYSNLSQKWRIEIINNKKYNPNFLLYIHTDNGYEIIKEFENDIENIVKNIETNKNIKNKDI